MGVKPKQQIDRFWDIRASAEENSPPELIFYGDISSDSWWEDDVTPQGFSKELKELGDASEIVVRINSPGGDPIAATAIYTRLKEHSATITVKIDGWACSAATIIAMAGDVIKIPANGVFMIHDPKVGLMGYYSEQDLEARQKQLVTIRQSIINTYAAKTGKSTDEIFQLMSDETWYTGDAAVESGFCDELLDTEVELDVENASKVFVNSVAMDLSRFSCVPELSNTQLGGQSHLSNTNKNTHESEEKQVPEIKNVTELRVAYPDLVSEIENSARESAVTEERERIQGIENLSLTGFEELISEAKFKKPVSAETVAMQIIGKQKEMGTEFLTNREQDTQDSGVNKVGGTAHGTGAQTSDDKWSDVLNEAYPQESKKGD